MKAETATMLRSTMEQAGGKFIGIEHHGKHPRVVFTTARGTRRFYVFSASPSCHRWLRNACSHLRRIVETVS
jgi:hypothetical protein